MRNVCAVELVDRWVLDDLARFESDVQGRILDAVEELQEQIEIWDRYFLDTGITTLQGTGDETVYRQRIGEFRAYYVRRGDTLYCIGVGPRETTYDRDLSTVLDRADDVRDS